MKRLFPGVVIAAAALPMMMGINECEPYEPLADCELVGFNLTADGMLTLTNGNDIAIATDVNIQASVCTNQSCDYTGSYVAEILQAGESRTFVADQVSEFCDDVFCCATGYTGQAAATAYIYEGSCTIGVAATQPSCNINPRVESWVN